MSTGVVWGIRAGAAGEADSLFLKKNFIAIGWKELGDLGKLVANREAFKAAVTEWYPGKKPGAVPVDAGQLFRFIHEMKVGDLAVYPSKVDRQLHIGEITGSYQYQPNLNESFPHVRSVKWLRTVPRTHFTQGALYEANSIMTLFQIKNYSDEFRDALVAKDVTKIVEGDPTVAQVAKDIEETTRDFILKRLAQDLKGHPLQFFISQLLETMGYRTRVFPVGPDGGVDLIAHKDELGFEPPIIKVQVKAGVGTVGDPIVSALFGKVAHGEFGLVITLGTFTKQARDFERSKGNLRLIDGQQLVELILLHYEQFDSRYKGLIPLKMVFVPELIED